jgi:hypothetical protein
MMNKLQLCGGEYMQLTVFQILNYRSINDSGQKTSRDRSADLSHVAHPSHTPDSFQPKHGN